MKDFLTLSIGFAVLLSFILCPGYLPAADSKSEVSSIELKQDDPKGQLSVIIEGRTALVYQYVDWLDLPHYWPLNSPSGKNMLVQQTDPYPHHRSFWFADTVRLGQGRDVSTYNALYSGQRIGKKALTEESVFGPPFKDHVRHRSFTRLESEGDIAEIVSQSIWEMDGTVPLLDEERTLIVHALGNGEYLLDMKFVLTANYGDVEFVSDDVHYAWPYLRLQTRYSGENGGILTSDTGLTGQEKTNMQFARWIDYSNTVEGESEGVAVFQWPDGQEHRWLTREYGCFGPRRPDSRSGKPFVLKVGESLSQHVGILVHKGGVKDGQVALRYQEYIAGKWQP